MKLQILEVKNASGNVLRNSFYHGNSNFGIVCIPGFGRNSFEKKFSVVTELEQKSITYLGFNPRGILPSKGDFRFTTFESLITDLESTLDEFIKVTQVKSVKLIAHSLGALLAVHMLRKNTLIDRVVLLAPALNQKDLNIF